jgi:hypothetical protein
MTDDDVLQTITAAGSGLSYPSERDAPLLPYRFAGEPTAAALLAAEGKPPSTHVEEETLDAFLEGLLDAGPDASEVDRRDASAWRALKETIERELTDVRVYWVGEVDVDAYVLGRAPSGAWLGLKTHAVET